ncbi:MAG: cupin domain-containing protein [Caldilineales bacterium]|nr:cupin domain-containing protein [Caldilineales bacterium]
MKVEQLSARLDTSGEVLFGPDMAGTMTTYMIYGRLAARETGRRLRPGKGREEILFVVNGQVRLEVTGYEELMCEAGTAISLPEGSDCWLSNTTGREVQYVIAGGFTEPAHFLRQVQQAQNQVGNR